MLHSICYVSSKDENITPQQVIELLDFCREKNISLGIKGVLLYSEGNFFQVLEGEKKVVEGLFEKIKKDKRHHGLIQIIGQDIENGSSASYKVDVITEDHKINEEILKECIGVLEGIPPEIFSSMEKMLRMFLALR